MTHGACCGRGLLQSDGRHDVACDLDLGHGMLQLPTFTWLNDEQLLCLDGIVLLLNASPWFTTFDDCSFLREFSTQQDTDPPRAELRLGGLRVCQTCTTPVHSLDRMLQYGSTNVYVGQEGIMRSAEDRTHGTEEQRDASLWDVVDQQCALGGEELAPSCCPDIQFFARLNVITFNTLSADEDRSCGLNYQASLTWVTNRLCAADADIAGLQETRLSVDRQGIKYRDTQFTLLTLSMEKGGSWHLCVNVIISICGRAVSYVVAHAPTREAYVAEHEDFVKNLGAALNGRDSSAWILIDLNVRVKGLEANYPAVVGSQGVTACAKKAMHARGMLNLLQKKKLAMLNTFCRRRHQHHMETP
eukprot:5169033-Amphidinium_carterae.2